MWGRQHHTQLQQSRGYKSRCTVQATHPPLQEPQVLCPGCSRKLWARGVFPVGHKIGPVLSWGKKRAEQFSALTPRPEVATVAHELCNTLLWQEAKFAPFANCAELLRYQFPSKNFLHFLPFKLWKGRRNFAWILETAAETCEHFSPCSSVTPAGFILLFHPSCPSSSLRVADNGWGRWRYLYCWHWESKRKALISHLRQKNVHDLCRCTYMPVVLLGLPPPPPPF